MVRMGMIAEHGSRMPDAGWEGRFKNSIKNM